jgi:hypothetical protein
VTCHVPAARQGTRFLREARLGAAERAEREDRLDWQSQHPPAEQHAPLRVLTASGRCWGPQSESPCRALCWGRSRDSMCPLP